MFIYDFVKNKTFYRITEHTQKTFFPPILNKGKHGLASHKYNALLVSTTYKSL